MDQKRIGAFIAQCRKEKNMTQLQLAEQLEITKQAVSKWETGRGMPDISLLQPLCHCLDISLNELLAGEHIAAEEYKEKAEETISRLFKEKQTANYKPVTGAASMCAGIALLAAALELTVGLAGVLLNRMIWDVMGMNAAVWFILYLVLTGMRVREKSRLQKRKRFGASVDAEVVDTIPSAWIRLGNYVSCRIVCRFCYQGKEYKAVSGCCVLAPSKRKEDLYAKVYMEQGNPASYSVELFQKAE